MASHAQTGEQLDKFLALSNAPVIDLRELSRFQAGHLQGAAQFDAQSIICNMHQLPARDVPLRIVYHENDKCHQQAIFDLKEKGYQLRALLTWNDQIQRELVELTLLETGHQVPRLWQPAPLVEEFVKTYANPDSNGKALDIACGAGRDAVYLAMHAWQVSAIDYLPGSLEKLQSLANRHQVSVDTLCLDLEQTDNPLQAIDEQFDLILVVRYLHRPLLDRLSVKLRPGGYLVYQTFMQGCEKFGSPRNPRFLLGENELAEKFAELIILKDEVVFLADGRPTKSFIAQKPRTD